MQYKIIGWTSYEDTRFPDVCDTYERYRLECTLIREIRKCGYRFGGDDHQYRDGCVPVFNSGEALRLSMREWGCVMAQAWREDNSNGYGYMTREYAYEGGRNLCYPEAVVNVEQIVDKSTLEYEPELDEEQYIAGPRSAEEYMETLRKVRDFVDTNNVLILPSPESAIDHPLVFEMSLNEEPFLQIERGEKTIELRLLDEKRHRIEVGDTIQFVMVDHRERHFRTKVVALHKYDSFEKLFSTELFAKCGFGNTTIEQAIRCMRRFYSEEKENEYGVVGIELEVTMKDEYT